MFRSLLAFAVVLCMFPHEEDADAGGRFGRWLRQQRMQRQTHQPISQTPANPEPTIFGLGISVGSYPPYGYPAPGQFNPYRFDSYIYDPYQSGSFEAPDLLNDPYFRERHRYDSQFPGRRYRK